MLCLAAPVNVAIGAEVVGFTDETGGAGGTDVDDTGAGGGATAEVVHCAHELDAGGAGGGGTTDVVDTEGVEGFDGSLH